MHAPTTPTPPVPLEPLRQQIRGPVLASADDGYDTAAAGYYGGPAARPGAIIVQPRDADDVATVIRLARDAGVELAIRSGGHSILHHSSTDGGLLLDLSLLRGIEIDPTDRTAWADAGVLTGELTRAAADHGLVIGFGDAPSVGISGITLGGGVGYLSRVHGLTIDNLLAVEIVTADGQLRRVDAEHESELFWALRGGGGNFGVVTRLQYRLHALGPIQAGTLILQVMTAPPLPFLPPEVHGELVVMALVAHAGDVAAGQAAADRLRGVATPLFDDVKARSYGELFEEEDPEDFRPRAVTRTQFRDHVDRDTAEAALAQLRVAPADLAAVQIRVLGGAIDRVPPNATAGQWADDAAATLHEDGVDGAYVNFHGVDGGLEAVYPPVGGAAVGGQAPL